MYKHTHTHTHTNKHTHTHKHIHPSSLPFPPSLSLSLPPSPPLISLSHAGGDICNVQGLHSGYSPTFVFTCIQHPSLTHSLTHSSSLPPTLSRPPSSCLSLSLSLYLFLSGMNDPWLTSALPLFSPSLLSLSSLPLCSPSVLSLSSLSCSHSLPYLSRSLALSLVVARVLALAL